MLILHCTLIVEEESLLSQRISCRNFVADQLRLFVLILIVHFLTEESQLSAPNLLCVLFPTRTKDKLAIV